MENENENNDVSIDDIAASAWADIQARETAGNIEETPDKTPDETPDETISTEDEGETELEKPEIKAPSSWKKELQSRFGEIPEEFRQEIQKREEDFHKGIAKYKEAADFVKQLEPIAPALQQLQARYGDSIKPISQLVELDDFASKDPVGFIQWFAKSKGIPLDGTGIDKIEANPMLQTLQQRLDQLTGYVETQRQSQEQQEHRNAATQIEQFRSSGKAEHFEILRNDMAALLQAGVASSIEDAYEKALWQRQDLRQDLIAKQLKSEQEKAKKAAEQAKKAASVNISQRGKTPNKPTDDPAEIVRRKAAELGF